MDTAAGVRTGHAHASARYGAMSRPGPSPKPVEEPEDWVAFRKRELLVGNDHERRADRDYDRERFVW